MRSSLSQGALWLLKSFKSDGGFFSSVAKTETSVSDCASADGLEVNVANGTDSDNKK